MSTNFSAAGMKPAVRAPSPAVARPYYVYLLECRGGRLYTGITTDVARRLADHRGGTRGAKFTRAYPPVKLLAVRQTANRSEALRLEAALKKLPHAEKLRWAERFAGQPAGSL